MQEFINHILLEAKSALRFRWHGMALVWVVCLVGWTWVITQPNVYEASARVFVDTSSVLEPFLTNQIVTPNVETRLAYVREALTGRPQLELVASKVGLDANAKTIGDRDSVVTELRDDIEIFTAGRTGGSPDNVYSISYSNPDRDTAVGVVSTLLDTFVSDMLGENRRGGDTAAKFLDERVKEYEARLQAAEQALAEFKKAHADRLPGAEGDYFNRMQTERDALAQARRDLRILDAKRSELSAQLSGQGSMTSSLALSNEEPPPNSIDARIRDYRAQLDSMLLQYTERHPDVIALREALARLLAQREQQLAALGLQGTDRELVSLADNPVHQALRISLNETEVEMATLRTDIEERTAKVGGLQELINEVPEVEAELARLNRDYEVVSEQYVELVRSRETQDLTRKATDTDQIDVRIINPPSAGVAPAGPDRLKLFAGVFVAALAIGGGGCYLLAQLWPVFGTTRRLRELVQLPVLGVVTHAWKDHRRQQVRKAMVAYAAVFAGLVIVFGALVGIELVGPGVHELVS